MKRWISVIALILLALTMAACGGGDEPTVESPTPTTAPFEQPEETAPAPPTPTLAPPIIIEPEAAPTASGQPPETVVAGPVFPWPADRFGYGVQSHAVVGDPKFAMDVIRNQLGMDWVKVQLEWPLVEPAADADQWFFYDGLVAEANAFGLNLMFSVVGAPAWTRVAGTTNGPPDDYSHYTAFLNELLEQYPGQIHAIEVWNEQNLDREWDTAGDLRPEDYVEFLGLAYAAIKAHDPNIIVISGALAPTGVSDGVTSVDDFTYLDGLLAAGVLDVADCVGVHHNGYNIAPDVAWDEASDAAEAATAGFRGPFDNPHHSWSFKTTLDTYAEKVQAVDPGKKLCVTEFGWASSEGYNAVPQNFEFVLDNTLEEQAQYIVQAFQQMHDSGDVWLAYLFNYDFGNKGNGPTDDPVPYSIIDTNGAPRPAFEAVGRMEKVP